MPVNLSQIRDLLLPGLYKVEGKYEQIEKTYDKVFTTGKSKMAFERVAEMRLLSLPRLKAEGAQTYFDNAAGERFIYNGVHQVVAQGYAVTEEAIEDNLYQSEFDLTNLNMIDVFNQYKEIQGANILNTATTYNALIGGDGKSLCATDHPVDGGTYPNRPTIDVDLNETSLLSAQIAVRTNFRDQANTRLLARARKLIVPTQLEPVAVRLTKTDLRPGTNNNDVNAIGYTAGGLPEGYIVMDYLTSQYAWFLKTSIEGLRYMTRRPFRTKMETEFTTNNLLVIGSERYVFFYSNPRAVFGSFPTS